MPATGERRRLYRHGDGSALPDEYGRTRADPSSLWHFGLRRLVLWPSARRRHRTREGSRPRPDGLLHRGESSLHRLWRDRPLDPGRALRAARDQAETLRFFFNDTATTEIYTLSLHDALPL